MDNKKREKIFPYVGVVTERKGHKISHFEQASPWKNANTAFYWSNFQYPLYHGHADWELHIVISDCIEQRINGTTRLLRPGDACLIGPKDKHALFYPNGVKNQYQGLCLIARDAYVHALLDMYSPTLYDEICKTPAPLYFSVSQSFLVNCSNSLLDIQTLNNQSSPNAKQQCNIIFSSVLLKFLQQRQTEFDIPSELRPFIQQLNNPSITSEQIKLAQSELPYSYPQLTRIFKKYMNCTITQYVNRAKLQHAKDLLTNTDMSLLEIINELNFESLSYFHKIFKSYFNVTPVEYRRNNSLTSLKIFD